MSSAAVTTPGIASATGEIRFDAVTKRYGEVTVIDDLSLTIEPGTFYALLGPSGCGKTTTLRMVGGFELPTEGNIYLDGADVSHLPPNKRDVNTVFQSYALFPHLTVLKNVMFGLERRGVGKAEVQRRATEALDAVELGHLAERKPTALSGGQQQRVALARALVNRPHALLLDEPLGALDLRLRRQLQVEIKRVHAEVGITFVHVTHDQEEAMTMADVIAVMNRGRIEQAGSARDLYDTPQTAFVANFLGQSNLIDATVTGTDGEWTVVQTHDGVKLKAPTDRVAATTGKLAVGVRPEKVWIWDRIEEADAGERENKLTARVTSSAFLGVSMEYRVETAAGDELIVTVQNNRRNASPPYANGTEVELSWAPEHTFVVAVGADV
ncbi:MAG: ABC transporter ATP-binding protein [Solirubrobacteraceae bacterium]|nr:ABC transporter ATP-binding protein [Solirubrobacteraceae bacterium]